MVSLEQRQQFYDRLARHDWFFEMSESSAVWNAGRDSLRDIERDMKDAPELADLYAAYAGYVFNNEPKPERPA